MPADLIFAPEVAMDLSEAHFWYQQKRPGLGDEFPGAVEACKERISAAPLMYRAVYAVIHTARAPEKWRERLM